MAQHVGDFLTQEEKDRLLDCTAERIHGSFLDKMHHSFNLFRPPKTLKTIVTDKLRIDGAYLFGNSILCGKNILGDFEVDGPIDPLKLLILSAKSHVAYETAHYLHMQGAPLNGEGFPLKEI